MLEVGSSTTIPCQVVSNHPALGGSPLSWSAEIERLDADILAIRNYVPCLDQVPAAGEASLHRFADSVVISDGFQDTSNPSIRQCKVLRLGAKEDPPELILLSLCLATVEGQFLQAYFGGVNRHALVKIGSGYDLLRYTEGNFYVEHCDVVHDHPVLGHRRLSIVLFANDDYEGGELYFPRQDVLVRPEKGMAIIFPSGVTHPHEVRPVLKGTRYTIVSWFF